MLLFPKTLEKIYKSKIEFHKKAAQKPFEEKYLDMLEMQKIDIEFSKHRPKTNDPKNKIKWVCPLPD